MNNINFCIIIFMLLLNSCSKESKNLELSKEHPKNTTHTQKVQENETKVYKIKVSRKIKHDTTAFTQGLFFYNNYLYESTGLKSMSSLRKIDPTTGEIIKTYNLPADYFAEGITHYNGKIYQLTWDSNICFVYELENFKLQKKFTYQGEGWGITTYKNMLVISDGTNILRFFNPEKFELLYTISITDNQGYPIHNINELELINNEIWANVWQTNLIIRINPETGKVNSYVDLSDLYKEIALAKNLDVLNGIAYDYSKNEIYVTGKNWPYIFVIELEA